jgi:hypothetical protein
METGYLETWKCGKIAVEHYVTGRPEEFCVTALSRLVDIIQGAWGSLETHSLAGQRFPVFGMNTA